LPVSLASAQASRLTFKAFFIAAAVDLSVSIEGMIEERWSHFCAVPATAQVIGRHSFTQRTGHRRYTLTCKYIDRAGGVRTGWFSLLAAETPHVVKEGVDGGKLPVAWELLYDPRWKRRRTRLRPWCSPT
jgi:hypothetical protein